MKPHSTIRTIMFLRLTAASPLMTRASALSIQPGQEARADLLTAALMENRDV